MKLSNLRKIINDKHVPYKAQILHIIEAGDDKIEVDESKDDNYLV